METTNANMEITNVQVCPLNAGIKINDTHVKDPNDNNIYKNDTWWGSILLGDVNAWHEWWESD